MADRNTEFGKDPRYVSDNRDNRSTEHNDPRIVRDETAGVADTDSTSFLTKGGLRTDKNIDQGTVSELNEFTTESGGIAIDGGKLAGNHDDFEGDLEGTRGHTVPGADPNNRVTPAHDMKTGDAGPTWNPD